MTRARTGRVLRGLAPAAFGLALASLALELLGPLEVAAAIELYGTLAGPLVLLSGLLAMLRLVVAPGRDDEGRPRPRRNATLVLCALTPLAVLAPWTIAPTHLGPAYAGLPFFVSWLTRHPTMAGVNHEVLLGMGALLGACALPAALAAYGAVVDRPRPRVVGALAILQLVAYVPVLVRLDADTLLYAWVVAREGQITLFGQIDGAWWQNALAALTVGAGAILRLAATLTMLAWIPLSLRAKEPPVLWET